jgi:TolB protein
MMHLRLSFFANAALAGMIAVGACGAQSSTSQTPTSQPGGGDESGALANPVQLTFADRFFKAGEAYFSPDDSRVIFQAVETPAEGAEPAEVYSMFVGRVTRDASGRISGLASIERVSPVGSANTCGWFHPTDPNAILFASTIGKPTPGAPPGYDRQSGRYRWMFPPEMRIVRCDLREADGTAAALTPITGSGTAYTAEGSWSADGRHLIYCSLDSGQGDLFVLDTTTGRSVKLVGNDGYDGGPFFSPEGRRICYRSDRKGNHLLQLFVADLAFDENGAITGIEREYQLTDNTDVNWAPYWHPDGRHIVYATSEVGHHNYEVFLIDADPGDLPGSSGSIKYGTRRQRVTNAARADVLPVFNRDGRTMMWTSQRGAGEKSQLWVADFVMPLDGRR